MACTVANGSYSTRLLICKLKGPVQQGTYLHFFKSGENRVFVIFW